MSTDAPPREAPLAPSLRDALRRARTESAERSGVLVELRTAELARLDILKDALAPVLAQVPEEIDLFEAAILPGEPARLFVDVLGFIEMGRDKRTYRFFQDTRYGRRLIAEGEKVEAMIEAVTDYVARRMVEREKALAADTLGETAPGDVEDMSAPSPPQPAGAPPPSFLTGAGEGGGHAVANGSAPDAVEETPSGERKGSLLLLFVVAMAATFAAFFLAGEVWDLGVGR